MNHNMPFNNSIRENKKCAVCSKPFLSKAKSQKYCSEECNEKVKKGKYLARMERLKLEKAGKELTESISMIHKKRDSREWTFTIIPVDYEYLGYKNVDDALGSKDRELVIKNAFDRDEKWKRWALEKMTSYWSATPFPHVDLPV